MESQMAEIDEVSDLEFKWGKKRGVGGKKKEVQFYESFTYDGVEYDLYDCVYMHKEGEPEPYIGKLIKLWENPDKTKKVKVQWFVCPLENLNVLGDVKVLEHEIFLASGEGVGLANVNPLEAIAGKCNVLCISIDSRNRQPTAEELKMADYIFYRTFDVKHYTIMDKMDDKVGGLEVKFIYNRKECETANGIQKLDSDRKEENRIACDDKQRPSSQNTPDEILKTDGNNKQSLAAKDEDVKDLLVKCEHFPVVKPASGLALNSNGLATTTVKQASSLGQQITRGKADLEKVIDNQENIAKKLKSAKDFYTLDSRPNKKVRTSDSVKLSEDKIMDGSWKLLACRNDVAAMATTAFEGNTKSIHGKDPVDKEKGLKYAKSYGDLEDRPSKKACIDCSIKISGDKTWTDGLTLPVNLDGNDAKDLLPACMSDWERTKSRLAIDFLGSKSPIKKEKPDDRTRKVCNGKLPVMSISEFANEEGKSERKVFEVIQRPDTENRKWFRTLPWEQRIQKAHEQGTLVLLQNLDPEDTSREVEDIIWHAFQENCATKMIQHTAISSPHSGQACVIFKTREAAESAFSKLNEGCLMLPNGRPLVGSTGPPPNFPEKQSTYFGHLVIDKLKVQLQKEMKDAVSTSHCSQPNTIEYEMAMEWCLLQSRSDSWWKRLYTQQGQDLRKLKANDKLK